MRENQVYLILEAIDAVRGQLKKAAESGEGPIVLWEITTRLITLYSLLDTNAVRAMIERRELETRPFQNVRKLKRAA